MRTALLLPKLLEVELMKQRSGEWPVLLLDEVMAELDPVRRGALLNLLDMVEQAFITTTDLEMFEPDFLAKHECLEGGAKESFQRKIWHEDQSQTSRVDSRVLIAIVLGMNLACAIDFIARPELYQTSYELSGEVGRVAVIGFGILFLMWQVPYFFALYHPGTQKISLFQAILMQTLGFFGESLLLQTIPMEHAVLRKGRFCALSGLMDEGYC